MAGRASRTGDGTSRCPSCSAPTLTQLVGQTCALKVTVSLPGPDEHLPYGPAAAASTTDDLVWCLPRQGLRPLRLRWTTGRHPPDCSHQHLLAHHCATEPTTLF